MLFKEVSKEIVKHFNHNKHEAQLNITSHQGKKYLMGLFLLQKNIKKCWHCQILISYVMAQV